MDLDKNKTSETMLNLVLDEFINYLSVVRHYSARTLPGYRSNLTNFFNQSGIRIPAEITPKLAEDYMAYRISIGRKPNTNCHFMNALRAFLIFCNKRGHTNVQIELFETPRRIRTRMEFVSGEEVNKMLSVMYTERNRLILLILFTSGARVSELIQMSVEDFTDNKFTVMAKGNKEHTYYFDPVVADRLRAYMVMEGIITGPIFRKTNGQPLNAPAIRHIIKKAAKLAKISHNVFPHQLRHGFGTTMHDNGADIRDIQVALGHDSIQSTQIYVHVSDEKLKQNHQRFAPQVHAATYPQQMANRGSLSERNPQAF